jgi:DNA-directed RNA polymerase subunit RPC12/RpoP
VGKGEPEKRAAVFDACPHCGQKLSPWQQVLLSVDRALMCKNCWYRIILDIRRENEKRETKHDDKPGT